MANRKVKMLVSMAGPEDSFDPGKEYEFDEATAIALCTLPEEGPRAVAVGWDPSGKKPARKPAAAKPAAARKNRSRKPAETAAVETSETGAQPAARKRIRIPGRRK